MIVVSLAKVNLTDARGKQDVHSQFSPTGTIGHARYVLRYAARFDHQTEGLWWPDPDVVRRNTLLDLREWTTQTASNGLDGIGKRVWRLPAEPTVLLHVDADGWGMQSQLKRATASTVRVDKTQSVQVQPEIGVAFLAAPFVLMPPNDDLVETTARELVS